MSIQLSQVLDYLDAHPARHFDGSFESFLDLICSVYTESNPIETEKIRLKFSEIDAITESLSLQESDKLFDTVLSLCIEYERSAFSHGLLAGLLMMTELNALP